MAMPLMEIHAADWPMWRFDAGRTAASPENLPDELQLLWTRKGSPRVQAWDDPLNLDLMSYDRLFEPIVMDGRMFVGYSDRDKVSAFNTETGEELWSYFTDAPVRLAPAGWNGAVYITSDDGKLHCVDAVSGRLKWQFDGTAGPRKVLGNRRLISAWPARGGAVIRDGKVYFATSIWPFMGVFIYSLDAETGVVEWVNDSTGSTYIKQPHSAPAFAGVAPQGALVATGTDLIVPGGRSIPAIFDRKSGELRYFELAASGKGTGGSFVAANDKSYFVHTRGKGVREFRLSDGKRTEFAPNEPVLHQGFVYSAEVNQDGVPVVRAYNAARELIWEVNADGRGDLILAGDRLYSAGPAGLFAISLDEQSPRVVWTSTVEGQVERLLAADEKLFAVTLEGDLLAFAASSNKTAVQISEMLKPVVVPVEAQQQAQKLLASGDAEGYALWYGAADESLIHAIAAVSPFIQLAVVDEDAERVDRLRRSWDAAGLLGKVTAHHATPTGFDASPYLAQLVVVGAELSNSLSADPIALTKVYSSVRPYGGVLQLRASGDARNQIAELVHAAQLEQAKIELTDEAVIVRREGALPGSANWTHQYGNVANTGKSDDRRVRLPLGILWFGGSSHLDVLPRHGHGPPQQVVDGRLFIQGINVLSARDVYTGRVLWRRQFENLGTFDVYYNETYAETPLDTSYNQVHIPGANGRGTNYVVTPDSIYLVEGANCHVLEPATGETRQIIPLPQDKPNEPQDWSYLGVYEDVLIAGVGFARYRDRLGLSFAEEEKDLRGNKLGFASKSLDRAGSLGLIGFDRKTGRQLWRVNAEHSFWNNGIVAGQGHIFCLDRLPKTVEDKLRRRGKSQAESYRIVALDAKTGEIAWEKRDGVFGTWLSYSDKHDLLLQAGAAASDRLSVEVDHGMTVYRGKDGEILWSKPDLKYSGPCILHNDLIITNANSYRESAGAFSLLTGEPDEIKNPLTGERAPWKITRTYGCNTIIASEHLLTFRSGAAGFYDLSTHGGTGNFGGFKSGCTSNLIAAGGVLNAPDYTRTCSCSYQNQTSLALVHMPEIELWTVNQLASVKEVGKRVDSVGINFGAPGHHRAADGLLWIESPSVAGEISPLEITQDSTMKVYRRHSNAISHPDYPWVFASGVSGEGEIEISTVIRSQEKPEEKKTGAGKTAPAKLEPPKVPGKPLAYNVRLFFGVPKGVLSPGAITFDVVIDDVTVLSDVTIEEGQTEIRELPEVLLGDSFRVRLNSKEGSPVLSGIELRRCSK